MKLWKLLLTLCLLTQVTLSWSQDDVNMEEEWSDETSVPATVTPIPMEDAAGEEEMPVYDENADY